MHESTSAPRHSQGNDAAPFTIVPNSLLRDPRLGLAAKGIALAMLDERRELTLEELVATSSDSLEELVAGLAELRAAGYLEEAGK